MISAAKITSLLTDLYNGLTSQISNSSNNIIKKLKRTIVKIQFKIIRKTQSFFHFFQEQIDRSFLNQIAEIAEPLTLQRSGLVGALKQTYELTVQPVLVGIPSGVGEIVTS